MKLRRYAFPLVGLGLIVTSATSVLGRQHLANITRITTGFFEHSQFAHHPFDIELVGALLDRYLDTLDGARSLFPQTDVDEFAADRATLAQATRGAGDTHMARTIFGRYLERLEQRTSYVADTPRTATFDFTGHDVYSFDREHASRPRDQRAAQELWRQQLRAEYLQEELDDRHPEQIVSTLAPIRAAPAHHEGSGAG